MLCRLCKSANTKVAIKFSPMPIGDSYLKNPVKQTEYVMDLYLCLDCGLAQFPEVVNKDDIYKPYIYRTSDSLGLVEHFKKYVDKIYDRFKFRQGSLAIDIGSNDGTVLRFFKSKGMKVLGVDPATQIAMEATQSGVHTINDFFTHNLAKKIKQEHGEAEVVTTNNTFANIDDIHDYVLGIKELLSPTGVLVFETGYALDMLEKSIIDNIYHEHLSYFSIKPLDQFFKSLGMTLIDVERIIPKGGSIRCMVMKGTQKQSDYVRYLIEMEEDAGLHTMEAFTMLSRSLDLIGDQLRAILSKVRKEGKKVAGYGASVGITTMVYNFKLGRGMLDYLVDDNPNRQGLTSPGFHIIVRPSSVLAEEMPDYVVLLAWQYTKPILERCRPYLKKGGRVILVMPQVRVIDQYDAIMH